MKLSKDQRHTAYILLLEELNESEKLNGDAYLCFLWEDLLGTSVYGPGDTAISELPELYLKKPIVNHESGGWFHETDFDSRRQILQRCIEETANF